MLGAGPWSGFEVNKWVHSVDFRAFYQTATRAVKVCTHFHAGSLSFWTSKGVTIASPTHIDGVLSKQFGSTQ